MRYRVEMTGHVGSRFAEAFDVVLVEVRGGRTILTVDLEDQAALHGLFEVLASCGIELVAVNRAATPARATRRSPG